MAETLTHRAKSAPGWGAWARSEAARYAAEDQADGERMARILAAFIDPAELSEAVGALRAAGFHR